LSADFVLGFFFSGEGVGAECPDSVDDRVRIEATDVASSIVLRVMATWEFVVDSFRSGRFVVIFS
jgi:hypothetical protein